MVYNTVCSDQCTKIKGASYTFFLRTCYPPFLPSTLRNTRAINLALCVCVCACTHTGSPLLQGCCQLRRITGVHLGSQAPRPCTPAGLWGCSRSPGGQRWSGSIFPSLLLWAGHLRRGETGRQSVHVYKQLGKRTDVQFYLLDNPIWFLQLCCLLF